MRQDSHQTSGMTLTSLLIAVAIGSVVMLTLATLVNNIFKLSNRTNALAAADQTTRLVYQIVTDQALCPNALRTTSNAHVTFTPPTSAPYTYSVDVPRISITRLGQADQVAVSTEDPTGNPPTNVNNRIAPDMKLASIKLQEVTPGAGRSVTTFTPPSGTSTTYDVYNAKLVLTFSKIHSSNNNDSLAGGSLASREVPIVVTVNQSTRTVDYCYISEARIRHHALCTNLGGTWDDTTGTCTQSWKPSGDCSPGAVGAPACPAPSGPNCGPVRFITGFDDTTGAAQCACIERCTSSPPPIPPPPPPLPAVTFPSKAKATYPLGSGPMGWGFGT